MNEERLSVYSLADTEVTVKDNVAYAPKDQRALLFCPSLCLLQRKVQLRRRFVARANALNFLKAAKNHILEDDGEDEAAAQSASAAAE